MVTQKPMYGSFNHNHQKQEILQMFLKWEMNKQWHIYAWNTTQLEKGIYY